MLEVQNLVKVYHPKKGVPVMALNNVNLKFEETGMVFVLGKSGSGKSTLLNLIGGLDTITNGDVIIKGKSSSNFNQSDFDSYRNTFIGFIFQEYNILNEFTVGQNIALALELQGKRADYRAVENILQQVDLQGYYYRKPNEMSGGQKQRIAIARALIKDPEIIMADEPTGALDSNTGKQVFETLKKLSKTKLVIIVSHDRDYAEYYGDRVIEFADGRVISDIKKYKAQSQVISSGVSVIDDKIVHVKKGHKFSAAEKEEIISFLENSQSEMILSKDEKSNADFRRLARIDAEGNKDSFEVTSPKNQNIKQYDPNNLKLIRSRLPFRHALKVGASSLKIKPIRLFITILLSAIAFGLFGLSDTLGAYNKYEATYSSMKSAGIDYASFRKGEGSIYENGDYSDWLNEMQMSKEDADSIQAMFPSLNFDKLIYPGYHNGWDSVLDYGGNIFEAKKNNSNLFNNMGLYYTHGGNTAFGGIIETNANDFSDNRFRGYSYIGEYPKANDEIMISRHVYEAFRDFGLYDIEKYIADNSLDIAEYKITLQKEEDLLKRKIVIGNNDNMLFKVVGVIDTKFPSIYDAYKTNEEAGGNLWDYVVAEEIRALFNYSYHGAIIAKQGAMDSVFAQEEQKFMSLYGASSSVQFDFYGYYYSFEYAANKNQIGTDLTAMYIDPLKTDLNNNEILISKAMADQLYINMNGDWFYFDEYNPSHKAFLDKEIMDTYDKDEFILYVKGLMTMIGFDDPVDGWIDFDDIGEVEAYMISKSGTEEEFIVDMWAQKYFGHLTLSSLEQVYRACCSHDYYYFSSRDLFGIDFALRFDAAYQKAAAKALLKELFGGSTAIQLNLEIYNSRYYNQVPCNIVGIAFEEGEGSKSFNYSYSAVFGDDIYQRFSFSQDNILALITTLPDSKADQMELIRFSYETTVIDSTTNMKGEEGYVQFTLKNSVSQTLSSINSLIEILAKVFLFVGIGFAVFAAFLLMNFIMVSISYKKKEIGILRAIGAKSSDVFRIFFYESLIIALISFIFAIIGAGVGAFFINMALRTEMGFIIQLLSFGLRQIALVLAVSVGVAAVSSFLPVYLAASKKPIETIRTA